LAVCVCVRARDGVDRPQPRRPCHLCAPAMSALPLPAFLLPTLPLPALPLRLSHIRATALPAPSLLTVSVTPGA
jgi:hypothetical protein